MQILETLIKEQTSTSSVVELTLADADNLEASDEYIVFQVKIDHGEIPFLARVQEYALHRARSLIAEQYTALEAQIDETL